MKSTRGIYVHAKEMFVFLPKFPSFKIKQQMLTTQKYAEDCPDSGLPLACVPIPRSAEAPACLWPMILWPPLHYISQLWQLLIFMWIQVRLRKVLDMSCHSHIPGLHLKQLY